MPEGIAENLNQQFGLSTTFNGTHGGGRASLSRSRRVKRRCGGVGCGVIGGTHGVSRRRIEGRQRRRGEGQIGDLGRTGDSTFCHRVGTDYGEAQLVVADGPIRVSFHHLDRAAASRVREQVPDATAAADGEESQFAVAGPAVQVPEHRHRIGRR
jgi:hypothetical protein